MERRSALGLRYLYFAPTTKADSPLPMLLFLHGARARGEDLSLITQIRSTPPWLAAAGARVTEQFVVVCPQTSARSWGSRLLRAQIAGLVGGLCP